MAPYYNLTPHDVTPGSDKKVWWECNNSECKYEWPAMISSRSNGSGCPNCAKGMVFSEQTKRFYHSKIECRCVESLDDCTRDGINGDRFIEKFEEQVKIPGLINNGHNSTCDILLILKNGVIMWIEIDGLGDRRGSLGSARCRRLPYSHPENRKINHYKRIGVKFITPFISSEKTAYEEFKSVLLKIYYDEFVNSKTNVLESNKEEVNISKEYILRSLR
jgi:hypothetical protein